MRRLCLFFTLNLVIVSLFAQVLPEEENLRKDALNVYMESTDFIKREIPFLNYVRDLKDAQVIVISSYQRTGAGGWEYTYFLEGQGDLSGMKDTLVVATSPDDTQDRIRQKQVAALKMAFMRYMLDSPLAKYIDIRFTQPIKEEVTTDKWDSWVFKSRLNGMLSGQKTYRSSDLTGSFSASRITKDMKLIVDLSYSSEINKYFISDMVIKSRNIENSVEVLSVKSLNDHWSAGGTVEVGSSTFNNMEFQGTLLPGVEYNLFPYSESTRHQFRILYKAGFRYNKYNEMTMFDKMKDYLWLHTAEVNYSVIQKWGSVSVGTDWLNYFHDWDLNNLSLSGVIEYRITKGLSINLSGSTSLIHDQIALAKEGATPEEILTRQKEMATAYSYRLRFGVSYTFGSIFNNVVNPRFGNGNNNMLFF